MPNLQETLLSSDGTTFQEEKVNIAKDNGWFDGYEMQGKIEIPMRTGYEFLNDVGGSEIWFPVPEGEVNYRSTTSRPEPTTISTSTTTTRTTTTTTPMPTTTSTTTTQALITKPEPIRDFIAILTSEQVPCTAYYISTHKMTWMHARDFCQSRNLQLATVCSQMENQLLKYYTQKHQINPWLGGLRISKTNFWESDKFVWNDGKPITCTNWQPREPNNVYHNEYCLRTDFDGFWLDWYCGDELIDVVCERRNCYPRCES